MALLAGCGRWGFSDVDALSGDTLGDALGGDGMLGIDAAGLTTVSFGERPGATHTAVTADTTISSTSPTTNNGAEDSLQLSASVTGLLRFDISALPPSTTVVAAAVHLATENTPTIGVVTLYPVLESWTEGTAMGTAGVANYTMRTAAASWTNPGAGPPSSRSTTAAASFTPTAGNTDYTIPLDANGVAQVQAWISNPASNLGFALVGTSGTGELGSRETVPAARCPLLVVTIQ